MKLYNDTMKDDPISDEYIREFYGIVEPLTGEDLDNEVLRITRERNAEWEKNKEK